jgi:hypothetical protein
MDPIDHMRGLLRIFSVVLLVGTELNLPASAALAESRSQRLPIQQSVNSGSLSETRSTGSVIVGENGNIYIYSNTLKLVGQINNVGMAVGLALDGAGDLYISNEGAPGVAVYANDYKTQIATLSNPYPSDGVAVSKNGTVAVLDAPSTVNGHVTFFATGSTNPCASVTLSNVLPLLQGSFDAAGNLYVTGEDLNHNPVVGVIPGGCSATGVTILSTATKFTYLFGIQITRFGKLAVEDSANHVIYTFDPPHNGALGKPIATTELSATSPEQFAFTADGAFLFTAEQSQAVVAKFAYPAGGTALQTFGRGQLFHPVGLVITSPTSQ